jgi:hypothetical protein
VAGEEPGEIGSGPPAPEIEPGSASPVVRAALDSFIPSREHLLHTVRLGNNHFCFPMAASLTPDDAATSSAALAARSESRARFWDSMRAARAAGLVGEYPAAVGAQVSHCGACDKRDDRYESHAIVRSHM